MFRLLLLTIFYVCLLFPLLDAKVPELTHQIVGKKMDEIMKSHASYKELTPTIIERSLTNYIDELDPTKTYFIESDIDEWIYPSDKLLSVTLDNFKNNQFPMYEEIYEKMLMAIERRHELDKQVSMDDLPKHVSYDEFKKLKWATDEKELLGRIIKIKALQLEAANKLDDELKEKSIQRIEKRQAKYEEELETTDPLKKENLILSKILKATASALDTHTSYFTPDEASQFMINVQQRLFGIGAQLRDDINGFTVVKVVDGGPAAKSKLLKVKDRIIAVDGEPIVGMDIVDAVELIRGLENTPVILTVVREIQDEDGKKEETLEIPIVRGEVVLKESRYESSYEPFGDGIIAYIRLHSFYQDPDSSSATDITNEFQKLRESHKVKGLILDLRSNSGGLLAQAVAVAGLFITKGIVVSIKNENGEIQNLRDIDGKTIWNGPLVVLMNRSSASASEIVGQALKDYGRALIVGDDHSFGKGSYQTFTLNATKGTVNPEGEYKVTRGRYYTVSGNTPQMIGVSSDIIVPSVFSESDVGEKHSKFPLESDSIKSNFEDDLSDISPSQRDKIVSLYRFNLQPKLTTYVPYLHRLSDNSKERIHNNKNYQNFITELKKMDQDMVDGETEEEFGQNDLQLVEAYNIMKDLLMLIMVEDGSVKIKPKASEPVEQSQEAEEELQEVIGE